MNAIRKAHRSAVGLLCGALLMWPPATLAGASSATFQVAVRLVPTSHGVCASAPSGGSAEADFTVTCTSGHFVSMSPSAVSDAILRMRLIRGSSGTGAVHRPDGPAPHEPPAGVTAMQVSHAGGGDHGQVEILVSF